nr:MAG TPA: ATPase [Caudoviricetes sp.]
MEFSPGGRGSGRSHLVQQRRRGPALPDKERGRQPGLQDGKHSGRRCPGSPHRRSQGNGGGRPPGRHGGCHLRD